MIWSPKIFFGRKWRLGDRIFPALSQTWELRPPKGLGVSGPILQVVLLARFWFKKCQYGVHMPLREP